MEPNFKKQKLCLKAKKSTSKPFNVLSENRGTNEASSARILDAKVIDLTESDDVIDKVGDIR